MGFKYAVVQWQNYRKYLQAGFLGAFNNFEVAKQLAYQLALRDSNDKDPEDAGVVITEEMITDKNGPGKAGSPYARHALVGYGGSKTGYDTTFYVVVEWFDGVENDWEQGFTNEKEKSGEWIPKYKYVY